MAFTAKLFRNYFNWQTAATKGLIADLKVIRKMNDNKIVMGSIKKTETVAGTEPGNYPSSHGTK